MLSNCNKFFEIIGNSLQSPFLLLIRLIWGYHFFIAGFGKLSNLSQVSGFFANLDIPFPAFSAFIVGIFELLGGASLFLGFKARLMAIFLVVIMTFAYISAHSKDLSAFSFITNPIIFAKEAPFSFLYTSLIVFIFGTGKYSIDYWTTRNKRT
jgi:putative oxidoreductase